MAQNDPRTVLERLIVRHGDDYSGLSKLVGRNAAYIQQFIKRGTPRSLPERERGILARYYGIDERLLGAPETTAARPRLKLIPKLAVAASAGGGSFESDDMLSGKIGFAPKWLQKLVPSPDKLSLITVRGESMAPTLNDGDDIMVDGGDASSPLRDGIYVLRMDDALMVKRLAIGPVGRLSVLSDNPDWPDWQDVQPDDLHVIGRVVWVGRKL